MIKWRVIIPMPKAKRNLANVKLIIHRGDGWCANAPLIYQVKTDDLKEDDEEIGAFEFELEDSCENQYETTCLDGYTFTVEALYQNATKSRKESYRLLPERVI